MDGMAPCNGVVAVMKNSQEVEESAVKADGRYEEVAQECNKEGSLLGTKAPIRIGIRRFGKEKGSKFCLFISTWNLFAIPFSVLVILMGLIGDIESDRRWSS